MTLPNKLGYVVGHGRTTQRSSIDVESQDGALYEDLPEGADTVIELSHFVNGEKVVVSRQFFRSIRRDITRRGRGPGQMGRPRLLSR